jgi:hypothetical protein
VVTIKLRRRTALLALALLGIIAAGVGIASWSTSTSGNGYSKATTASALTLSDASASTSGDLYPGAAGDLKLKVANPNNFPVRITAVSLTSGGTITSNVSACNTAGHGVTLTNQSGLAIDLAANAPATVETIAGAVHMANSSDNSCQGAIFTIPVDVTAASN